MIASLFGMTKEVVSLNPVKNIIATELVTMLCTVIDVVQQSGFVIVALIADNNQVNCKAFEMLASTGKLEHDIPNPNFPDKRIFILFDTVHIMKCIRNNWLNQGDVDQTFCYPVIPEHLHKTALLLNSRAAETNSDASVEVEPQSMFSVYSHMFPQICLSTLTSSVASTMVSASISKAVASLSCLKNIYKAEQNSLVEMAPKLSYKSLYPTNLERQQVSLVLNVFNEYNVQALIHHGSDQACQTADFVRLICAWWRIVNVKHSLKGVFKRDYLSWQFRTQWIRDSIFLRNLAHG